MTTSEFMRRLFAWRPGAYVVNSIVWGLCFALPLGYAVLVKEIFDVLSGNAHAGFNAPTLIAILAGAYATRQIALLFGFKTYPAYHVSAQVFCRRNLLEHLMLAPGSRTMPESPSAAVSRFRDDVDDVCDYLETWTDAWGSILYGVGAITFLFWIDPVIAATIILPLSAITFVTWRLTPTIRKLRRRNREHTARITDFIGETIAAVQAVKVAGEEASLAEHFRKLCDDRHKSALANVLMTEALQWLNSGVVSAGIGVVLAAAAWKLGRHTFTVGDLVLYIQLLGRLTQILILIGNIMSKHRRVSVATERMQQLLVDASPAQIVNPAPLILTGPRAPFMPEPPRGTRLQTLDVSDLTFRYPNSETGIQGVSFRLRRGDFVVITGRIGSGKTTLLRALQGLLPKQSGQIVWNGREVDDPASFFAPPHSSYTAQVPQLFSETLRDNVLIGDPQYDHLWPALDWAAMELDLLSLENGADTVIGPRGTKLSGGQVQRVGAARMFARHADLLIIDDLSSALDAATEQQVWRSLSSDCDSTVLMVSSRRSALRRATRILLLENGCVTGRGVLDELLATSAEMRRICNEDRGPEYHRVAGAAAITEPARS